MRKYFKILVGSFAVVAGFIVSAWVVAKFINLVNYFL